jgi:hypothetical protein
MTDIVNNQSQMLKPSDVWVFGSRANLNVKRDDIEITKDKDIFLSEIEKKSGQQKIDFINQ